MAHLWKVAIEACSAAAKDGGLFDQDYLLVAFRGFQRRRHAADAAAYDQYRLASRD
jgi:hypothetical protein